MKRYGNIYSKIYSMSNLRLAHQNARKDKSHYKDVIMVDENEELYLKQIQEMLISETYEVSEYVFSVINDKGKERELCKLPYFPDRIIQWACLIQIEHIFMEVFTTFSCASIKERGIHRASKLLDTYMEDRDNTKFCLKIDIRKFYPNINHRILKLMLRRKIKDCQLLGLLDKIIDSTEGDIGIPIGSYLSQFFANFYLSYFDHWLKEVRCVKYIIRYMDDVVILHESKEYLHELNLEMKEYLDSNLELEIKDNWQVFPTDTRGVDFVGYRHFYDFKLLRKGTCNRFKKKTISIRDKCENGEELTYSKWCSVNSYKGWLRWCDGYRLEKKYIAPIQFYLDDYYHKEILKVDTRQGSVKR